MNNPPPGRDHRVGGEDEAAPRGDRRRLLGRHPARIDLGKLARPRRLVDLGGDGRVGNDTEPRQQFQPAGRGRGEDEPHGAGPRAYLNR